MKVEYFHASRFGNGAMVAEERVRPVIDELLAPKNLKKVAEGCVFVTGLRGPLEEGWQKKVQDFTAQVSAVG